MRFLRNFWKNTRGSVPIEGLFGGLLLLGWYIIAFQFYDAFRARTTTLRASYTVGDLISREVDAIGPKYVDGAKRVFDYLTQAPNNAATWLRVSILSCEETEQDKRDCDGESKAFTLVASDVSSGSTAVPHTADTLKTVANRIPLIAAGDSAVLLESSYTYWPIFGIGEQEMKLDGETWTRQGLDSRLRFSDFVVTRPRGPRTVWDDTH